MILRLFVRCIFLTGKLFLPACSCLVPVQRLNKQAYPHTHRYGPAWRVTKAYLSAKMSTLHARYGIYCYAC